MSGPDKFTIGSDVSCRDGGCGKLIRVVVDPVARALTHLVVEPAHRSGLGRLVPIDLAEPEATGEIRLRCSMADFTQLPDAEETQFIPELSGLWGYGQGQVLSWPYYELGSAAAGMGGIDVGMVGGGTPQPVVQDRVPAGEVVVRRGEHVHATDGAIGRVQGLVVDPHDHLVTHVLLDEGHLWGKKTVAIPIGAVAAVNGGVRLTLTKDEVRDLPPIDFGEPQ